MIMKMTLLLWRCDYNYKNIDVFEATPATEGEEECEIETVDKRRRLLHIQLNVNILFWIWLG